ncbi:PQQ-binding-like beta-propeller repeat protein [Telmatocola sphagniphila]|nr:PQQ-binding-like beta-propeller repeat protein [Telmatocola sphagniphila]
MKLGRLVVSLASTLGITGLALAADWPQWRGPNRDGISEEKHLLKEWPKAGPKLLWKFDKAGTGHGSVSVAKGFVYLMGSDDVDTGKDEYVLCLNEKTGKEVWKHALGTTDGKYNFGYGNGPRGTPTVDGDKLYVLGAKGDLVCLNTKDGSPVWNKNLVKDFGGGIPTWGYAESPLIDGDKVVLTPGGGKGAVVALNKTTGETIWACKELKDGAGYSSIIIADVDGVKQYIQQSMESSFGVRASDGKLLWQQKNLGRRTAVIPTPVYYDHHVFCTTGYQVGCELIKLSKDGDGTKAEKVYANKAMINHHGGVVRVNDKIYGFNDKGGIWECLDFLKESEEPVWSSKKLGKGCITYANGNFILQAEDKGTIVMIEASPKGWIEKGRFELPQLTSLAHKGGKNWPHPVVANGKLFVRNYDLIYCYDISGTN